MCVDINPRVRVGGGKGEDGLSSRAKGMERWKADSGRDGPAPERERPDTGRCKTGRGGGWHG